MEGCREEYVGSCVHHFGYGRCSDILRWPPGKCELLLFQFEEARACMLESEFFYPGYLSSS